MDGLDVYIESNGERLKEYVDEDEESPPGTVDKFVEAQSGAKFAIGIKTGMDFAYRHHSIRYKVSVDGHVVDVLIIPSSNFSISYKHCVDGLRQKTGKHIRIKELFFSDLVIDENAGLRDRDHLETIKALGKITVEFWRVEITKTTYGDEQNCEKIPEILGKVGEKTLKGQAVSHHTRFGDAGKKSPERPTHHTRYIDKKSEPFAVYNIRYRSTKALKSIGLIARTPEPVPLEDRPIEDLTLEETRELLRRQRERSEQARTIKRERDRETIRPKLEPGARSQWEDGDDLSFIENRPAKRRRNNFDGPIETVDLTAD